MLFIKVLISRITGVAMIVCPCGHKSLSKRGAIRHLNKHPLAEGQLDLHSDNIIWL